MSAAPSDKPAASPPAPADGQANHGCLPRGYRLREFVIERVLGDGGFGVVYSALDLRLERRVAIKEYMPSALARRDIDYSVQMLTSQRHRDAFEVGLRSFINEARLLARFEHPALIKVHQFWQEKGTAYMVMPFYSAPTLRAWIRGRSEPVSEAWLRRFLLVALDAVEALHAESCLHRDIAPDNILVLKDAAPLLLDFGAARRVIGDLRKALTVIVKPGFAPLEQYADSAQMKQGPWSDVYALAAVAHYALTGHAPAPAVSRVLTDEVVPLRVRLKGKYSDALLGALDTALAVKPERRPQTIAAFRALLVSERADEWKPTRLIHRAEVGSSTHKAIEMATRAAQAAADMGTLNRPRTAAPKGVQRTAAAAAIESNTRPATLQADAPTMLRSLARFADVATLTEVVRSHIPDAVRQSRWLGVAGYAAALLACCGTLALTAYLVEAYVDANTRPVTGANVVAQKTDPAQKSEAPPPAAPAVESPPRRLTGTGAMVEAKPTEVTLAPAKIDLPSLAPVAPAPAAAAPAAPAAKPKPAPQPKVATIDHGAREAGTDALLFTSAPPVPAAAGAATHGKTRGLDDMVMPGERATEIAPLRALEHPQPQFPAMAANNGVRHGRVVAHVTVNSDGSIGRVDIADATPSNVFDKEVRRALAGWRFEAPGQPRQTTVEFLFKLEQ